MFNVCQISLLSSFSGQGRMFNVCQISLLSRLSRAADVTMGNCSSDLRRHMRHNNVSGVLRVVQEAGEGSPDIINEDFTADCILDSCQRNMNTPVHTALSFHQMEILEILLQYGGDPNAPSRHYGQTALHQAARQNNMAAVTMLLKYGADLHATDNSGRLPIHCAAGSLTARTRNNVDVLRHLAEIGRPEDVRAKDASGNTPLHFAVKAECLEAVKYLLERGADMNAANDVGKTPRDLARIYFKQELDNL